MGGGVGWGGSWVPKVIAGGAGAWGSVCGALPNFVLFLGPRMECGRVVGDRASCMAEFERWEEDEGVGRPGLTRTGPEGMLELVADGFLFSLDVCFPEVSSEEGGGCSTNGCVLGFELELDDSACFASVGSLIAVVGRSVLSATSAGTEPEAKFSGTGEIRCPSVDPRPG